MNIAKMMKQVQDMQSKMGDSKIVWVMSMSRGSPAMVSVTVVMNGKAEMKKISIDAKLIDPSEKEMLEDMIVAACNDAKAKAEEMIAGETEKMMGGLKLPPGVKLPF